jgi:flavin-dependent dehydrogenase
VKDFALEKAVEHYYSRVGFYSFLGSKVIYDLKRSSLAVLNYTRMCQELWNQTETSRIELFTNTRAVKLEKSKERITIHCEGDQKRPITCSLLIDASGSCFLSSKFMKDRIPRFYSNAYGFEMDNCSISEDQLDELSFFMGASIGSGGGWFYPISGQKCRFGIAEIGSKPFASLERLQGKFDFAKKNMMPFSKMISDGQQSSAETGSIPAEPMKRLVSDRIMRVGDAAGHATPHMLEGLRPSIENGRLCASIAAEACQKRDFDRKFLRKYENTWHRKYENMYLFLLSKAEVVFSRDDRSVERSISMESRNVNKSPDACVRGLRGFFHFPFSLSYQLSQPQSVRENCRILARFVYHKARWIFED